MHTLQHLRILLLVSMFYLTWASAQNYPSKPIRIHTTGAGGGTDLVARLVATEIAPRLGQSVIVENQPNPNLLTVGVAKAAPDGHTLLVWGPAFWVGPLVQEAPYDVMRDFVAVSMLTRSPNVLVVSGFLPARSVADLIKLAKSRPGELNYSTGANGSSAHIAGELLKSMTGTSIVRIVYKGGAAQELADLMSGEIHMTFNSGAGIWAAQIKSGKLRALATGGSSRSKLYPDVPTIGETMPGFVSEAIFAMFAPARTPEAIVRRLNQETVRTFENFEVRERLQLAGLEPAGGPPEQLTEAIKAEIARAVKVLRQTSAKPGS